jgi:hypothetical protein
VSVRGNVREQIYYVVVIGVKSDGTCAVWTMDRMEDSRVPTVWTMDRMEDSSVPIITAM